MNTFIDSDLSDDIDIVPIFDEIISDETIRPTTILAFLDKYADDEKHSILNLSKRISRILFVGYAMKFKGNDIELSALVKIANILGPSVTTTYFFASIKKFMKDSSFIRSLKILELKSYNKESNPYAKSLGRYREQYDNEFMKLYNDLGEDLSKMLSYIVNTVRFDSNFEFIFGCPLFIRFFQLDVFDGLNEDDKAKFILKIYGYCNMINIKHCIDGYIIYAIKNFIVELLNSENHEDYKDYAFIELMNLINETNQYDYYYGYTGHEAQTEKTYSQIVIELTLSGSKMDAETYANLIQDFLHMNSKEKLISNLNEMVDDENLKEKHKYIISYIKFKLKNV